MAELRTMYIWQKEKNILEVLFFDNAVPTQLILHSFKIWFLLIYLLKNKRKKLLFPYLFILHRYWAIWRKKCKKYCQLSIHSKCRWVPTSLTVFEGEGWEKNGASYWQCLWFFSNWISVQLLMEKFAYVEQGLILVDVFLLTVGRLSLSKVMTCIAEKQ